MAPIDWATLLQIVPSVGIAVAFGFFILRFLDRQDKHNDKRDNEWREYLALGREQYVGSISAITAELKTLTATITLLHTEIVAHDQWSKSEAVREQAVQKAMNEIRPSEMSKFADELADVIAGKQKKP